MFPIASLVVWLLLLVIPQGNDVLRTALERLQDNSVSDLVFLGAASLLLSLSIWYSMRWLLSAEMASLPLSGPPDSFSRIALPRIAGAAVPALVMVVVAWPGNFRRVPTTSLWLVAGAFGALTLALLYFFWGRATLATWLFGPSGGMKGGIGRTLSGAPGTLAEGQPLPVFTVRLLGWTLFISGLLAVVFLLFGLTVPRAVGAAAIAAIALASINLFGSFVLTYLPMRNGLPPLALWVLLYAVAIGAFNDNHGPRDAKVLTPVVAVRTSPADSFLSWSKDLPDGATYYIVAAEGGGLRAGFWTAAILQEMEKQLPGFSQRVFALSGVSGGAVGVAVWAAAARERLCRLTPAGAGAQAPVSGGPSATKILAADFLAPSIAGLFYDDLTQRFVPFPFAPLDRSRGLEEGWERAAYRVQGRPLERTMDGFYEGCDRLPELLLNSTVAETGQRAILTRLSTTGFVDTYDLNRVQLSTSRQTVAALALQSARFPLITPAGSVREAPADDQGVFARFFAGWWPDTKLRLVDGGYFDNSGIQTALEVLTQIQSTPKGKRLKPVLLVISSEAGEQHLCGPASADALCPLPLTTQPQTPPPVWRWLHESTPPLRGLFNVRDSHIRILAKRAVREFGLQVVVLPPPLSVDGLEAPLGWALSTRTREDLLDGAPVSLKPYAAALRLQK
ncbi:MAG: hypothetical protein ABI645_05350 [Pseudomonadota bacterium]